MEVVAVDLAEQSDRLVRTSLRTLTGQDTTQLIGEHAGIIDAIQARNSATAATLMRQHLDDARARVLAGLRRTIDLSPAPGKV
jgi:DNA-binding GntR family transcriptional regulator